MTNWKEEMCDRAILGKFKGTSEHEPSVYFVSLPDAIEVLGKVEEHFMVDYYTKAFSDNYTRIIEEKNQEISRLKAENRELRIRKTWAKKHLLNEERQRFRKALEEWMLSGEFNEIKLFKEHFREWLEPKGAEK